MHGLTIGYFQIFFSLFNKRTFRAKEWLSDLTHIFVFIRWPWKQNGCFKCTFDWDKPKKWMRHLFYKLRLRCGEVCFLSHALEKQHFSPWWFVKTRWDLGPLKKMDTMTLKWRRRRWMIEYLLPNRGLISRQFFSIMEKL